MIHIGRAGSKLGSFSEFEVKRGLASGQFFFTDLGWKEGMESWAPLSTFAEFSSTPPPMPPLPGESAGEEAGGPESAQPVGLPWDYRKEIGFFPAFGQTAWMILMNPTGAYARMHEAGGLASPLLYNLLGGWLGLIAGGIYLVVASRVTPRPADLTGMTALFYISPAKAMWELKFLVIMGPVVATVTTLVGSLIAHLFLMLAGGANKAYHVTLRVFCFAFGSAELLQLIPFCGNLIALVLLVICSVVGLAVAHGTTTGRSVAAMGLFMLLGFVCCIGLFMVAMGSDPAMMQEILKQ